MLSDRDEGGGGGEIEALDEVPCGFESGWAHQPESRRHRQLQDLLSDVPQCPPPYACLQIRLCSIECSLTLLVQRLTTSLISQLLTTIIPISMFHFACVRCAALLCLYSCGSAHLNSVEQASKRV